MKIFEFSQEQAIRVLRAYFSIRIATDRESLARSDRIAAGIAEHQWFVYCMNAAARGFPVRRKS